MKYYVGQEFLEEGSGRILTIRKITEGKRYHMPWKEGRGKSGSGFVTLLERDLDGYIYRKMLKLIKPRVCMYCKAKTERFEDKVVCTECYRIQEEEEK